MIEPKDTPEKIVDDLQDAAQPDFGCDRGEANEALEPFRKAPTRIQALIDAKAALLDEAMAAMEYAAGSFAQVPDDKTVPPIVLHDCRRKLEAVLAKRPVSRGE